MYLTYLLLFLVGLVLGLVVLQLEKKNKGFKNVSSPTIKVLFLVSLIITIIGFTMAYADVVKIGIYIFIPILTVFLVRKTFIYVQSNN
ncbi:hypothetical protein [Paraliobacillus sp. X-1268]|uniref:hypothetical protein n=1 Tax=Paraliobacillus sp. X-1268 TaxID=2213193 RepID=UPI000E3D2E3F|nr:hypothetical protein [Paraliobacillus sp. X-1268]